MSPDWKHLPGHLLDSVVGRLESPSDFLRFSLVCKLWYSIAKDNESKVSRITTPMLLICPNKKKDTWNVYNIKEKKLLDCQLDMPVKLYYGSSKGWIVTVEKDFRVTLINPFQRLIGRSMKENSFIRLPPLPFRSDIKHFYDPSCVQKCILSADPVLNANDCVLIVTYGEFGVMSFIRVGKDATWTCIDDRWSCIQDLAYFEGRFYAVGRDYKLLSFEITTQAISEIQLFGHCDTKIGPFSKYLVISNEKELLMIYRIFKVKKIHGLGVSRFKRVTTGFVIFEFNFDKREWKRKDTLDDTAIFLSDNSAICVDVLSSSGFEPNCIYFCNEENFYAYGHLPGVNCGGYNLKTESFFEPYTLEATTLAENSRWPPIWVIPSFRL